MYGYAGTVVSVGFTVTKYAYVPFGYSGVLQVLPLCSSKSPNPAMYS